MASQTRKKERAEAKLYPQELGHSVGMGSGCRVQGAGFRVQGAGFRVQGAGSTHVEVGLEDGDQAAPPEMLGLQVARPMVVRVPGAPESP